MSGLNKAQIIGHLGQDPDLRYLQNGNPVCDLRIATSEKWTDKAGQKQERTEWHRVSVFGKVAEACSKYLEKGRMVYVEGRIQTRNYDDKEGNKRFITEIIATDVQFLGGGKSEGGKFNPDEPKKRKAAPSDDFGYDGGPSASVASDPDSDIPF